MLNKTKITILALLFIFNIQTFAQDGDVNLPPLKPLRDGAALQGADGQLSYSQVLNRWFFRIATPPVNLSDIKVGQSFVMLENSALEKMVAAYKKDEIKDFRIWASFTQFEKTNKLYVSYFIPLSKPVVIIEPETVAAEFPAKDTNSLNVLPDEIRKELEPKRVVSTAEITTALESSKDAVMVNRIGFFRASQDGQSTFQLDALGRNRQTIEFVILENQEFENALESIGETFNPVRFKVSGVISRFDGKNYILLNRAVRALNHGNFAR